MPKPPAATLPRFLAPDLDPVQPTVRLPDVESRHLVRVLRLRAGDPVRVFDGRGNEFAATVAVAHDDAATLALTERVATPSEPPVALTLIQAVLKGEAMDAAVRDATMMGVARIRPVLTSHVAVKPALATRPGQTARWQRIAVASAKQSRRATVPGVEATTALADVLTTLPERSLLLVEPASATAAQPMRTALAGARPAAAALLVGPEGGWTGEEIAAAVAHRAVAVTLGALTLRADAVPLVALAIVRCLWDDAPPAGNGVSQEG
jgi:16S rRNA (uracil1498-N3)-methyltransferase